MYKKIPFIITVFLLVFALNTTTLAQEETHDFDPDTNQHFSIEDISFEIPSAWEELTDMENNNLRFATGSGIITISSSGSLNYSGSFFDESNTSQWINSVESSSSLSDITDASHTTLSLAKSELEVLVYTCSCVSGGAPIEVYDVVLPREDTKTLVTFFLFNYSYSSYTSSSDFYDILDSIDIINNEAELESEDSTVQDTEASAETEHVAAIDEEDEEDEEEAEAESKRNATRDTEAAIETEHVMTLGEENALKSADSYLKYSSFSRSGLIKQLEFEGYTTSEATYAADHCGADWYEQAAKTAERYLKYSSFSKEGLKSQLEYEGFTPAEANYGVKAVGY